MADPAKNLPVGGATVASDLKSLFSVLRTRRTVAFLYGFMAAFVVLTFFLAFNPSADASSPWFTNIFTAPAATDSDGSKYPSFISYFFPSSSSTQMGSDGGALQQPQTSAPPPLPNAPSRSNDTAVHPLPVKNDTQIPLVSDKSTENQTNTTQDSLQAATPTKTSQIPPLQPPTQNMSSSATVQAPPAKNRTSKQVTVTDKGVTNYTTSLSKKQGNKTVDAVAVPPEQKIQTLMDSLMNCDFFDGQWVKDESYPLYKPGSCSFIDEQFNCIRNGRPDTDFHKYRWKPNGCDLPRLNASRMLDMLRGKRLVFVGDSLNRNMWESLVCMLRNSVKDQSKVYEANGRHHFKGEASYSFIFKDYDCTVEFFVSPFLVREWEMRDKNGTHETLRLDLVGQSCNQYKDADILVFNTGHWWTHDKTSKGKDYYQEGSHVYGELNVLEAFRKALTTWARWVDANVNPKKSLVFFRGYSESHFSGGQWNSGGACDHEVQPIKNDTYLRGYPPKMEVLEKVLKGMKTQVSYLNITRMTDYRKDGHPSIYRKQHVPEAEKKSPMTFQDCSHWCLPGVPDAWNEILYGQLLVRLYQQQQNKS